MIIDYHDHNSLFFTSSMDSLLWMLLLLFGTLLGYFLHLSNRYYVGVSRTCCSSQTFSVGYTWAWHFASTRIQQNLDSRCFEIWRTQRSLKAILAAVNNDAEQVCWAQDDLFIFEAVDIFCGSFLYYSCVMHVFTGVLQYVSLLIQLNEDTSSSPANMSHAQFLKSP